MAKIERFTAEQVMFSDKERHAVACKHGIKKSAEELAQQMAYGIRLGYFKADEIERLVLNTMRKVEANINKLSDLDCGGNYAILMNNALIDQIRMGVIEDERF